MNILPISGITDYTNRLFRLEVKPCFKEAVVRESSYIIKVSFSCLSQTIQSIHRLGGNVINVTMFSTALPLFFETVGQEADPIASEPTATASQAMDSSKSNTLKSATPPSSQKSNTPGMSDKGRRGGKANPKS